MSKTNITVFLEVYNEEARIESCLKSFAWADELIVFDKHSTDRTYEISKKYATEVISVPFCQASENFLNNISMRSSCEWVFFPTASSLIHPNLVDEIVKLTTDTTFKYDVIGMPYGMYSLGIKSEYSPWKCLRKYTLIRSSALILSDKLHYEVGYASKRIYDMPFMNSDEVLYHCTHKDANDFFSRTMRYTNYEAEYFASQNRNQALRKSFFEILKSIAIVIFKRRSFVLGWDGVALGLAYICNFIMKFIYTWETHRETGNVVYPRLRSKMDALWDERNEQK